MLKFETQNNQHIDQIKKLTDEKTQLEDKIKQMNDKEARDTFHFTETQKNLDQMTMEHDDIIKKMKEEKEKVDTELKEIHDKFKTFKKKYKTLKDGQEE